MDSLNQVVYRNFTPSKEEREFVQVVLGEFEDKIPKNTQVTADFCFENNNIVGILNLKIDNNTHSSRYIDKNVPYVLTNLLRQAFDNSQKH